MKGFEMNNGWNWNKQMKSSKPCKPSKLSKLRNQMNKWLQALKENLISNNITYLSKPSKLRLWNIINKGSLPCNPFNPNIWIKSPVNQRAKVNLINNVRHANCQLNKISYK